MAKIPGVGVGAGSVGLEYVGSAEAVTDGVTGIVLPVDRPEAWVAALRRLSLDDDFCEALRRPARRWIEANFDVRANTEKLLKRLEAAAAS